MKGKHPKRRKDKYNPYNIYEETGKYFINFRDGEGNLHSFEISRELYEAFNEFELEDISYMHEWERHLEQSEVWDTTLDEVASKNTKSLEDEVFYNMQMTNLYKALENLPEVQKRRVKLYYYQELTLKQIAFIERRSAWAVDKSIKAALKQIKRYLDNEEDSMYQSK